MKNLFFIILSCFITSAVFAQRECGAIFPTDEEYEAMPKANLIEIAKYSKKKQSRDAAQIVMLACPTPGAQLGQGSCTAWACSYAAQTILGYDKFGNIENAKRSPSFVYNQTKATDDCDSGANTINVLNFLKNYGSCSYTSMPYNQYDCISQPSNDLKFEAGLNTIEWYPLVKNSVTDIKECLRLGFPVVINFNVTLSFDMMIDGNAIWADNSVPYDNEDGHRGGHACCIMGYDDTRQMFKVINSWGTNTGDGGFFWITYNLISNNCLKGAYVMYNLSDDIYPSLLGNDFICNSETYSINNLPTNATTTWSCSTYWGPIVYQTKALLCSEIDDERATFSRNIKNDTLLYTGNATVVAKIKLKNGIEKNFTKSVYAETPIKPNIQKPNQLTVSWFVGESRIIKETDFPILKASNLHWSITTPNGSIIHEHGTKEITFTPTTSGKHIFMVENIYGCGESKFDYLEYNIYPKFIFTYTNPTTDLLEGYVYTEDNINNPNLRATTTLNKERYLGKYDIELFNEQTGYYKKYSFPENSANVNISLTNMIKGSYIIRLIIEGQVVQVSNLLIK